MRRIAGLKACLSLVRPPLLKVVRMVGRCDVIFQIFMNKRSSAFSLFFGLWMMADANPVQVPYSTDFSSDFGDFFAPTGNGYNWGHDWRGGNYQSWVSAANRTVTASIQARELAGEEFYMKVTIDPVEIVGSGTSAGFAACGNSRTFGSYYLADVKPTENTFRILQISGGTTTIAAERQIENFSLGGGEPFDLEFSGIRAGNSITLSLTVRKDGESDTLTGTDSTSLDGSYFGLRCRNGGSRYELHFDDYLLRPLETISVTSSLDRIAPAGENYEYQIETDIDATFSVDGQLPAWMSLSGSGFLSGTPGAADFGTETIRVLVTSSEGAEARQEFTVTVPALSEPVISEFMADNDDTLNDEEGDSPDWIEISNPTSTELDLTGWHLTDDAMVLDRWTFPNGAMLPPLGHLVIFASGKDLPGHTSFRLNDSAGSYLALVRPDLSIASEYEDYPGQREDVSYGLFDDYLAGGYFQEPTPGVVNSQIAYSGFTADTKFSMPRGFYEAAFTTEVSCETPGAVIVTTTDGTVPSLSNGVQSASPANVAISKTTVLRAAAFVDGLAPTNVDTQTYLFLDDVRTQSRSEALENGWPSGSVNGQTFDYGMDPEIINSISEAEFEEAMTDIPTLSFVTDLDNFNDPETGFWVNAENRGRDWERPVSVEFINSDGTSGFQIDAGVRLRGGFSRQGSNAKHSFRLAFRSEYGAGKLEYPMFGEEGAERFDAIDLRASQGGGASWHFGHSTSATFNRDVFARETQRDMGQAYSRSRHYHLYVNGQYFGLFQTQERVDADYSASYFGGEKEDYDVIKTRTRPHRVELLDGDPGAWTRLFDAAVAGFSSDAAYYAVQGLTTAGEVDAAGENLLDIDNLIDYMLVIFYTGQRDGPVNLGANVPKNFFAMRPRGGRFGFRFFIHDNEDSLGSSSVNVTGDNGTGDRLTYFNPKWLHQRLSSNALYRQRFGDRVHRHCFNGGALTPQECRERFSATADVIQNAVIGESARWGDARRSSPYDQGNWQTAVNSALSGFLLARTSALVGQLRSRNLYPDVTAPGFSLHGGQVMAGFGLTIDAPDGEIYYTVDGSDPAGPGGILFDASSTTDTLIEARAEEWSYLVTGTPLSDSEVVAGHPSYNANDWKHPGFDATTWTVGDAPLGYGGVGTPGWATEISRGDGANPNRTTYLRKSFEVTGASNYSGLTFNIRRDDGAIVYLNGREVARSNMPAGNVTYSDTAAGNASSANESTYFTESHVLSMGELVEGANILAVEVHQGSATSGDLVIDVELLGINTNGSGVLIGENTVVKARAFEGGEWSALNEAAFFTSSPASSETLVISEIYYNPPGNSEDTEYLELLNVSTNESIHLDGLSFVEGISFDFPPGIVLEPGERILLVKNLAEFEAAFGAGLPVVGQYGGSLNNGGEQLTLAGIVDFVYEDSFPWPEASDGGGRSLVLAGGDPQLASSWRASAVEAGSPGASDSTSFTGGDFEAYVFGGIAGRFSRDLDFTYSRNLAAGDVSYVLETSDDLETWSEAHDWIKVSERVLDGNFSEVTWAPETVVVRKFVRVRASR